MLQPAGSGWPASRNPRVIVPAGAGAFRVGALSIVPPATTPPLGLCAGKFAWADTATGTASNTRTSAAQRLGLVVPLTLSGRNLWLIPPGYELTLVEGGDFFARFPGGANPGDAVYALSVDGTPVSGNTAGSELTPWHVVIGCGPGGLAVISTWSFPQ